MQSFASEQTCEKLAIYCYYSRPMSFTAGLYGIVWTVKKGKPMAERIKLSVIMPVYNAEKYLNRAIESVLSQTLTELELLVINDQSKDGSLAIMRQWEKRDSRVRVIDKKNEGVSRARNDGLLHARGDYITFVDADDYVEPNAYETTLRYLEEGAAQGPLFSFFDENEQERKEILLPWETGTILTEKEIWEQLIPYMIKVYPEDTIEGNIFGSVWRLVVKREEIRKHQVQFDPDLQIAEDFDFCIHLFAKCSRIAIVNECFYHYIRWGNTAMAVYRKNQFQEGMENQRRLKRFLIEEGKYEQLERRYIGSYLDVCIGSLVNFVRPGGPGLFTKLSELREVVDCIAADSIYEKLNQVPLTKNQKLVMNLIRKTWAVAIFVLTKIRQIKKGR